MSVQSVPARPKSSPTKVVVVTTIMLTFISFWRAAAVVLNDMSSTAYYIGGIVEEAIGKAAPWFILLVMLFAYAVRSVYVESCSMFVRGGVYRVVREAMGITMAKVSVSALIFDYVLTGPISTVCAGQYVHGLMDSTFRHFFGHPFPVPAPGFAVVFAIGATAYFWRLNIRGIEESSQKALRIMQITTVMVVMIIGWSLYTMAVQHKFHLPPLIPHLKPHALGWLSGAEWVRTMGLAMFVVSFGHSILALSGEETLAQVYREIEAPKRKNLLRTGLVIVVYCLVFTTFVSFAAVMIIPDQARLAAKDNLISGLVLHMQGPHALKLAMQAFVVIVGAMILSGAANTAIIGANGVLNRVAEDGVLADWFRNPHRRFGTSSRIINLIACLQVATILISRGNVYILGEAYAFGVVWSFAFMSMSMLMLRWKYKGVRDWKVPLNFRFRGIEIPVGLGLITFTLWALAVVNFFTKTVATMAGVSFTAAFFTLFGLSEWWNHRKRMQTGIPHEHKEKFFLDHSSDLTPEVLGLPQDRTRILVPVRDPNNLAHLRVALQEAEERQTEVIVMTIKVEKGDQSFEHVFTEEEERLFTKVVELAERYGERIAPIVVPSNNSWFAIALTARDLEVDEILMGKSGRINPEVQLEQIAMMWAMVNEGGKPVKVRIESTGESPLQAML